MERAAILAVFQLVIQPACLFERPLAVEHDPGVDLGLPLVDLCEAAVQNLDACRSALAQGATDPGDRLVGRREKPRVAAG